MLSDVGLMVIYVNYIRISENLWLMIDGNVIVEVCGDVLVLLFFCK